MNRFPWMRAGRAACAALLLGAFALSAQAVDADALKQLASDDFDEKAAAIESIAGKPDPMTLPVLKALQDGTLRVDGQGAGWIKSESGVVDAMTGKPAEMPSPEPDEVTINNNLRGQIDAALAALKLFAPERGVRLAVRSVLLQGVLTAKPLPPHLAGLALARVAAAAAADRAGLTLPAYAIAAACGHPHIERVLIGLDSPAQLATALAGAAHPVAVDPALHVGGPLTDPRTWNAG